MTDRPPVLDYVPLRYRHRTTWTAEFTTATAGAALVVGLIRWRGLDVPAWGQGLIVGVPLALLVLSCLPGMTAECRVEGSSLWFRAANGWPVCVPIDDVVAIDRVDGLEDHHHYELVVRIRGRMRVGPEVFDPLDPLRRVLRAENPGIRFGSHAAAHCRACGAERFPTGGIPGTAEAIRLMRQRACPACGQPFPRLGVFVPDHRDA